MRCHATPDFPGQPSTVSICGGPGALSIYFPSHSSTAKMTAKDTPDHVPSGNEKNGVHHVEKSSFAEESLKPALPNADHTGAAAKTDPAEIALVRKIDWRLMVCLHLRSNHVRALSETLLANAVHHVLSQLRGPKRDCASSAEQPGK